MFFNACNALCGQKAKELRIARVDKRKIFAKFYLMGPHGLIDTSVDIEKLARETKLLDPGGTYYLDSKPATPQNPRLTSGT